MPLDLSIVGKPTDPAAFSYTWKDTVLYALGSRHGYDAVVRRGGSAVIATLAVFWFAGATSM